MIKSYYKEHKEVFEKNFAKVLAGFDMEAIHKMRTSTKRLRALLILIKYLSADKFSAKKHLQELRMLFKYAGKIREIQIECALVTSYAQKDTKNYGEYLDYLCVREKKEITKFIRSLPEIDRKGHILDDAEIMTAIGNISENKVAKKAGKFIRLKKEMITGLNRHPLSYRNIHANRTHLKQIYYLYEILCKLTDQDKIFNMKSDQIHETEQLIGSWHDLVNSRQLMKGYFNTRNSVKSKKYRDLRKRITADRKNMLKQIADVLQSSGLKEKSKSR